MPDVLILLGQPEGSPFSASLATALKRAIEQDAEAKRSPLRIKILRIKVLRLPELAALIDAGQLELGNHLICPLTLDLPDWLTFPAQEIYRRCQDVAPLRQQVQQWGNSVGDGNLWLPIVHTARGTLYGEAIGETESCYTQPIHLSDRQRQSLYPLGLRMVRSLQAPPGVYLMQFGLRDQEVVFDRLFPFPATPAIASCTVQTPDLFVCHWRCISGQPIRDLEISGLVTSGNRTARI